jgi:transposase
MKEKIYPSNISREQFEKIREILESSKKKTRPRERDLYDVFNGILYILKSGCQWRMLPSEFPNWKICHYYFTEWRKTTDKGRTSVLDRSLKKIGWRGPRKTGAEIGNQFSYC